MDLDEDEVARWIALGKNPPSPSATLLAFPNAGAGTSKFMPWARHLPETFRFGVFRLPGREGRIRDEPFDDMTELIEAILPAVEAVVDGPHAFFGHSMGGLAAYELAYQRVRRGLRPPGHLAVAATPSPDAPDPGPTLHKLEREDFLHEIEQYGAMPDRALENEELLDLLVPALRADVKKGETFEPGDRDPLSVSLSIYGGDDDPIVHSKDLEGWDRFVSGDPSIHVLEGGHFFLHNDLASFLSRLVADLRSHLGPL